MSTPATSSVTTNAATPPPSAHANAAILVVGLRCNVNLSVGGHSELIREIIEQFCAYFTPGAEVVCVGDTGDKHGVFNTSLLGSLGVDVDLHGKMPDVVVYWRQKNWLVLIEAVTSHGPVNPKRHQELKELFAGCSAGFVFVTAFPDKKTMIKYLDDIAWETEVWVADSPTHIIHFNGERFLGPYEQGQESSRRLPSG